MAYGRRILKIPTMIIFSIFFLMNSFKIPTIWKWSFIFRLTGRFLGLIGLISIQGAVTGDIRQMGVAIQTQFKTTPDGLMQVKVSFYSFWNDLVSLIILHHFVESDKEFINFHVANAGIIPFYYCSIWTLRQRLWIAILQD